MNLRGWLEARIAREMASAEHRVNVLAIVPSVERLAERAEGAVLRYVEALVPNRSERRAVLEREVLAEAWPLDADNRFPRYLGEERSPESDALLTLGDGRFFWPKEIADADVIRALRRLDDEDAKRVADLIELDRFRMHLSEDGGLSHASWRLADLGPAWFGDPPETPRPLVGLRTASVWDPRAVAVVVLAERRVQADRRRLAIAVDAGSAHDRMLAAMRGFPKDPAAKIQGQYVPEHRPERFELWTPETKIQLSLPFDANGHLSEAMVETLRRWRGWFGIRHWAALQRLLSVEGGRSGRVRWRMNEHLEALGYSRRWREDPKHLALIGREVELLTSLELAVYTADGQLRHRRALLLPTDKFERLHGSEWTLEGMELEVHPWLYRGVRDPESDRVGSSWFPQAVGLPKIDHARFPHAILLGLVLPIRWRWDWKDGRDHTRMSGETLLRTAGIGFEPKDPKRIWDRLRRNLDQLTRIDALGRYAWDDHPWSLQGVCALYPPQWARDRTIHALPPVEGPPRARLVPATGGELVAWRKAQGLTQAEMASRAGVNEKTIRRAEAQAAAKLGPGLTKALAKLGAEEPLEALAPGCEA